MSAAPTRLRRPLGRCLTLHERMRVYLVEGGLEIDLIDAYEVQRQRVFFEDVRLITLHRSRSRATLWLTGLSAAVFGLIAALVAAEQVSAGIIFFAITCAPFLVPFLIAAAHPVAQVTVFGKRGKAVMRWWFLHGSAAAVYQELSELTGAFQSEARTRAAERRQQEVSPFAAPGDPAGPGPAGGAAPAAAPAAPPPSA